MLCWNFILDLYPLSSPCKNDCPIWTLIFPFPFILQEIAIHSGFCYAELTGIINLLPDEDAPETLGLSPVLQRTLVQNESKSLRSTLSLLEVSARSKG